MFKYEKNIQFTTFSKRNTDLMRLAPEDSHPGHFFCGTPLPFTFMTHQMNVGVKRAKQ